MSVEESPFDPPAAHSMDTAWYAVDAEGNIGLFETGEDGAMPSDAADTSGECFDPHLLDGIRVGRRLAALSNADVDDAINARDARLPGGAAHGLKGIPRRDAAVVLRLRDEALVGGYRGERIAAVEVHLGERPLVLSERPRVVASRRRCPPAAVDALRAAPLGLVVTEDEFGEWLDDAEDGDAGDGGLYRYRQQELGEHTGPGAYVQTFAPAEPLNIEKIEGLAGADAAAETLSALSAVRFSEPFATLRQVHLADSFADGDVVRWSQDVDLRGNYTGPCQSGPAVSRAAASSNFAGGRERTGPEASPEVRAQTERRRVWILILGFAVLFVGVALAVVHKKRVRAERQRAAEGRPSSESLGGTVTGRRLRRP